MNGEICTEGDDHRDRLFGPIAADVSAADITRLPRRHLKIAVGLLVRGTSLKRVLILRNARWKHDEAVVVGPLDVVGVASCAVRRAVQLCFLVQQHQCVLRLLRQQAEHI